MFNEFPIIVAGSGSSVPFPDNQPDPQLVKVVNSNITVGLNYFDKYYCDTTWLSFVDGSLSQPFYQSNLQWLKKKELIIGRFNTVIGELALENTILLPGMSSIIKRYFGREGLYVKYKKCLKCEKYYLKSEPFFQCPDCRCYLYNIGIYPSHLSTLFAISLAIALGFSEIYLLGSDAKEIDGKTHFYQDIIDMKDKRFGGVGVKIRSDKKRVHKTGTYDRVDELNNDESKFGAFKKVHKEGIKIFNVSPKSNISVFPKITYEQFYQQIGTHSIDQDKTRKEVKEYIIKKSVDNPQKI